MTDAEWEAWADRRSEDTRIAMDSNAKDRHFVEMLESLASMPPRERQKRMPRAAEILRSVHTERFPINEKMLREILKLWLEDEQSRAAKLAQHGLMCGGVEP